MPEKTTLDDLNRHLFEQLERLNDEDLEGEKLKTEMERSKAVCQVAGVIVNNARLALDAEIARAEEGRAIERIPRMIGPGNGKAA